MSNETPNVEGLMAPPRTADFLVDNEGQNVILQPIMGEPSRRNYTRVNVSTTMQFDATVGDFVVTEATARIFSKHGEVEQPISEPFSDTDVNRLMENVKRWIAKHLLGAKLPAT